MVKTKKPHKKPQQEQNDDSGAVALLAIGATIGLWAWLRSRKAPAPAVPFARSQATSRASQFVDFTKPRPQFGYSDRQTFGFAF